MVVHAYYPLAEPRVEREAGAARDAGFEVTVLSLRLDSEPARETIDGIRIHRVRLGHQRGAGIARMLFEYLAFCALAGWWLAARSVRRPFGIVQFHSPPDFLVCAGFLPRARGSRLILDIHDPSPQMFTARVAGPLSGVASRLLVWIERLSCWAADRVITVHEPYRRELVEHGIPPAKVHVVMNSVDETVLERSRSARSVVGPPAGFRIAYHGTITWWYGTDLIVEALRELRGEHDLDVEAVILGDGDALPDLRAAVTHAGLEPYVYLSDGYLPIDAALATVAEADCGVIPNRRSEINRFALSSKLFEYVALDIPVVVARLETLAAHFGPDEVTFFEPDDVASLAAAVRWVYQHPDQARRKARLARARAAQYSWVRGSRELALVYQMLAGK